jgi:pyridoxine kinase
MLHTSFFLVRTITDTKIVDKASLQKVLTILHETYSVPNVVISSIPMTEWMWDLTLTNVRTAFCDQEASLLCLASIRAAPGTVSNPPSAVYVGCVPLVPGYFSGVGDLFSALVLGHYSPSSSPLLSPNSLPPARPCRFTRADENARHAPCDGKVCIIVTLKRVHGHRRRTRRGGPRAADSADVRTRATSRPGP